MYFSHSPYRAPVLLTSVPQQHTNFINKSIYNALEEAPIETQAVRIFQTKQMLRQGLKEHSVDDGTALAPYQDAHLCTWVCLPHKMAPGLGNGPWKWLLPGAHSTLYRLEFFMWQLGCWDIHPRGCALIKDSSSGHFCTASCGHWPPFHPWACSYTTALLLGLPVTPNNTLGLSHDLSDSWPAWPPETPPLLSASQLEWSQTGEGHICPPQNGGYVLGLLKEEFSELTVSKHHVRNGQPHVSSWSSTAAILFTWKKFEHYSKTKQAIYHFCNSHWERISDRRHLSYWAFTWSSSKYLSCAAWMDPSRIITLLHPRPP